MHALPYEEKVRKRRMDDPNSPFDSGYLSKLLKRSFSVKCLPTSVASSLYPGSFPLIWWCISEATTAR